MMLKFLQLSVFFSVLPAAVQGHYAFYSVECRTLGSLENIEVLLELIYNKDTFLKYNSTENRVTANSAYGEKWARDLNNKSDWLRSEADNVMSICRKNIPSLSVMNKTVRPEVTVKSLRSVKGEGLSVLKCSAYGFYPSGITLTWLQDGQEVTQDLVSTQEMANGDWLYQVHSQLDIALKPGQSITCRVEHPSFPRPALFNWTQGHQSLSESDRDRTAVGTAVLLLGFLLTVTGLIYKRKQIRQRLTLLREGRTLGPQEVTATSQEEHTTHKKRNSRRQKENYKENENVMNETIHLTESDTELSTGCCQLNV
ncbi:rano class II histocompatibility antigen, A beta chain-like [Hoplias malabaricus]|uniref:rano class II histocompatibility antigen, A beta chain-like n=1 Tax=Hoplias malabaricus TaxID=27720 RepID=UPI0034629841